MLRHGHKLCPDFSEGLSLFVPLLIVALPVYDLTFTIFMRRKKRIPIAQKSKDHFVFIMKGLGFGEKKILALIYGMCILFSLSALFLKITPPSLKIWPLVFIATALFLLTGIISKAESGLR